MDWADFMAAQGSFGTDFYDRSILRPKHRAYYRSGRPVIKIGPKGALGSHEIRPIHYAPSLGQSIGLLQRVHENSGFQIRIKTKDLPWSTILHVLNLIFFSADTPFTQVKLGELGSWFARRNKSPAAAVQAISRTWWRWQHNYMLPRKAGVAGLYQLMAATCIVFYTMNYGKLKHHRNYKYH